jgi:uncharacterized iron-regulated membrane protein
MSSTETEQISRDAPGSPSRHRAFFLRLHFYAGLLVGPFLLIAAVTGGLYAVAPSIEQWVYRDYLRAEATDAPVPLVDQVRTAQAVRSDLTVTAVRPAAAPGDTTRVMFTDPALGPSERRAVFINPADGASKGELTVYGSSGALPLRTWIDNLHRSLHLGDPGRIYSELAASWLWLIALGGVFLWVSRYRRLRARDDSGARLLSVDPSVRGRRSTLNWHGATGIWIALGLVFLSATGLTWSTYAGAHVDDLRSALAWTTPTVSKSLTDGTATPVGADHGDHSMGGMPAAGTPRIDELDRVLQSARAAGIGGAVEIGIPSDAETAFVVAQTRQPWVMSNNSVAVDGATGRITDASWFADWPLAAKLAAWGIQLHMGLLFGIANQLALLALTVALTTVIVRGYLMWWQRRPTGRGFGGRPPRRGGLAALPVGTAVAVVVAAAAIGWFIPLLGISLAAFVGVDVAVGWWQRRRESSARQEQTTADARL